MPRSFKRFLTKSKSLRLLFFIAILIWCIGFASQSLFPDSAFAVITYPILKRTYATVCHQLDIKTFSFLGHKLFVCARCTGIYLGALIMSIASLIFFPKLSLKLKLLYAAILPVVFDVIMSTLNIYSYSKFVAFLTGLFFGSVVFLYILETVENYFSRDRIKDDK